MATAFDPTRFIQAENERLSQTLAAPASALATDEATPKTAENGHFWGEPEPALATIATLAGPTPENRKNQYPWDADLWRFVDAPCPEGVRPDKWDEIVGETYALRTRWADQAIGMGWSSLDLFGGPANPFARRVDLNGLARSLANLLTPVRVTTITPAYALLTDANGYQLKYHRRQRLGAVHLWEAYAMAGGP